MTLSKLVGLVCLVGSSFATASAAVHYVAGSSGNDANKCTEKAPCKTILRASQVAKPGDTVRIAPGQYEERVVLRQGGTEGSPVKYEGHDGKGCPVEAIQDPNSRGERPKPQVSMGGWVLSASHIELDCFEVANTKSPGVEITAKQRGFKVRNFYVHDGPAAIVNMARVPVEQMARDLYFQHNYITRTAYGFLVFCGDNCLFEDNEVERMIGTKPGSDNDYARIFGEGITFRRNYFHGNSAADCEKCHIDCFQTWNVRGGPFEVARRVTIDGNVCFNAHQGIIANDTNGKELASHVDWTVTNNIFSGGPDGSRMAWCSIFTHVGNVLFAHNLCGSGIVGYRKGADATHVNNIHYQNGLKPYVAETGATVRGATNILFNAARPYNRMGFPQDLLNVDPALMNPAQGDYRLRPGSPAMRKGSITSVRQDRFGRPRPKGELPDVGPYQGSGGTLGEASRHAAP
ncbi:hypothetical protein F183_A54800 (plasmid) [Bryobacterales bacterium F-183]|nr:hypothetical protein F183_A54800 [Bryobacterales bacterium F-183]